ncbi:hypothetical protein SAMN04515667_2655 [Formosa sp. Hel1_31_208]|uniref:hypothetical protein n=1 Tax=Formosa sp. Hel1_31_208 TaxID=1798225 RepID=UPI00087AE14D|nr:hypothetical protein [Formosa sp. Hel1_31_208]SDS64982.1 hypothetical protein SAMN04515667_2655 [Formosa sp. Hel1_31_208]
MKNKKLHTIKSAGFKTPDQYFDSFDAKIIARIKDKKTIEGIELPGFSVPENYFDSIEESVLNKLHLENDSPVIALSYRKSFYYIAGVAASLVLLFAIFINGNTNDELSVDMVENYLETRDLDSYELAQLLSDADLLEDGFTIIETSYNEDNLESYLLENADIQSILE